jgi:hypothetical protein
LVGRLIFIAAHFDVESVALEVLVAISVWRCSSPSCKIFVVRKLAFAGALKLLGGKVLRGSYDNQTVQR